MSCSTASSRRSSLKLLEDGGAAQVGLLALADAPGEHPLRERAPHQRAHPVALGDGQHLGLDAAVEDRVGRLLGAEPLQAAPLGHPLGLDDVGGGHRGRPDRADLAAVDQVRQRGQRLLDVGVGVRPVDLVEVDVVGLQAAQRVLDLGHDPAPGVAPLVGVIAHRACTLGRQDDVVAASLERLAHDLFGLAAGVRVGGVDEVDPGVQRLVDDADRVVVVGVADGPEHHRAERVGTDLDAGPAEGAVLHAVSPECGRCGERSCGAVPWTEAERFSGTIRKGFPVKQAEECRDREDGAGRSRPGRSGARRRRADCAPTRSATSSSLLEAAKSVFGTAGVDAPAKEIADLAGVGVGTLYRHFPQRSDLVKAVFQREVDACADAAPALSAAHEPGEALAQWLHRYTEFLATKRGLATALHSGDPAFDALPGYFMRRLGPALGSLLEAAAASWRDPRRHQPQGPPARRRQPVPARGGRGSRLQPAHGRAPHRRTALRRRPSAVVITSRHRS